jgi:hypothetical protein
MKPKPISQLQHDFYQYIEQLDNVAGDRFLKQHGLHKEHLTMPNVNLYCKARVLCDNNTLNNKDKTYLQNFMRFWKFKNGCVTKKNKKRVLGIINYYAQKEQNTALRNARLNRKKNLKLNGTQAEKC